MAPSKKSSVCDTPVKIENSLGVCEEPSEKKTHHISNDLKSLFKYASHKQCSFPNIKCHHWKGPEPKLLSH